MKKIIASLIFVVSFLCNTNMLFAQISFEQKLPITPTPALLQEFEGIYQELGCIEFADIDNDNDQDVILSGTNQNTTDYETGIKLFVNQGDGSFQLSGNNSFDSILGKIKFSDVDGDGYQDFFICGRREDFSKTTLLYRNTGLGSFELVTGTTFAGVFFGGLDVADIDSDNDPDLLIHGFDNNNDPITKLYKNNGAFNFTLISTVIPNVAQGECRFGNIDGDSDPDLIVSGITSSSSWVTKLYKNDGLGNFTIHNILMSNLQWANIDFGDVDNDSDLDLIISGHIVNSTSYTRLYLNNGNGDFALSSNNPFTQLHNGNLALVDMDNDSDLDAYIVGEGDNGIEPYAQELYLNDGTGVYVQDTTFNIQRTTSGNFAISDVNNDDYPDILMNGQSYLTPLGASYGLSICMLYINRGLDGFSHATGSTLPGVVRSSLAIADIDNDNDNDLFTSGLLNVASGMFSGLYKNDGAGNFELDTNFQCPGISTGASSFFDFDNDNDQDLIVLGILTDAYATFFVNDGSGNFTPTLSNTITNLTWSTINTVDIDNDNDLDLITTGETGIPQGSVAQVAKIYRNDGGFFTYLYVPSNSFSLNSCHQISAADIDNDGDIDLYAYGDLDDGIYFNDGLGNFTSSGTNPIDNLFNGESVFGDIDGDYNPDLIVTGVSATKIYTNDGNGNFTLINSNSVPGATDGSLDLVDIDSDNDLDLFITGRIDNEFHCISDIYLNDGSGGFTLLNTPYIKNTLNSNSLFSDLNNDDYPDLVLLGKPEKIDVNISNIYMNTSCLYYSMQEETICGSFNWIDGTTYTSSTTTPTWTLTSSIGCDSIVTLNLTIIPVEQTSIENVFSLPSDPNNCIGEFAIDISGNNNFELNVDNGAQTATSTAYTLFTGLCPGVHDLQIVNLCSDTTFTQFVIPVDSNYVFNNPFIDSLAQDSLGVTLENCDIYYAGIDTAYIDSIWANGNTVNVIWNIVDSNGSNFDTTTYELNNGNGVYWLQLSVFCPVKALGDYFAVTEAIYFENGTAYYSAGISEKSIDNITLYPNPTNDLITISFDGNQAHYTIYDAQGKLIQSSTISSGGTISLKEVETGVYFFELETENGRTVKRIVKN